MKKATSWLLLVWGVMLLLVDAVWLVAGNVRGGSGAVFVTGWPGFIVLLFVGSGAIWLARRRLKAQRAVSAN